MTMLIKQRNINWKEGSGTAMLGAFMMVFCFFAVLLLFAQHEAYNATNAVQIVTDSVADGSAILGQTPFDVDEALVVDSAKLLLKENENGSSGVSHNIACELVGVSVEMNFDRLYYRDFEINIKVNGKYTSPLINWHENNYSIPKRANVLSLSETRFSRGGPNAWDMARINDAISRLTELGYERDCFRADAIYKAATMLHWPYSRDFRWDYRRDSYNGFIGYRDCSSYVYTAFQDYCTFFDGSSGSSTQTIRTQGVKHGILKKWGTSERYLATKGTPDDVLKPGDILLYTTKERMTPPNVRTDGIGHTAIYLSNGYIMHAIGGDDGIRITRETSWNKTGSLSGQITGIIYYISIPDSMDRGTSLTNYIYNYSCRK